MNKYSRKEPSWKKELPIPREGEAFKGRGWLVNFTLRNNRTIRLLQKNTYKKDSDIKTTTGITIARTL